MLQVRFAREEDIGGWLGLLEQVKESFPGLDFKEYEAILRSKIKADEALAATDGGRIVGALLFSSSSRELEFLAADPSCRRQGIGSALVGHMLGLLPEGSDVSVITYREGDVAGDAARKFYLRLGFTARELVTVFDYPCQVLTREASLSAAPPSQG